MGASWSTVSPSSIVNKPWLEKATPIDRLQNPYGTAITQTSEDSKATWNPERIPQPQNPMTEKTIQNALWTYLSDKGHRPVIPNFTPPLWWECDVFSVTGAGYAQEFEIKISKSDFRADATKTQTFRRPLNLVETITKHEALERKDAAGPSRFSYVVPEGLVALEDVPAWAGLYEAYVHRKKIRIKCLRKPPGLHQQKATSEVIDKIYKTFMWRFWNLREKHYAV